MKINRKNDYVFKRIFCHKYTKVILADFLTEVLSVQIAPAFPKNTHECAKSDLGIKSVQQGGAWLFIGITYVLLLIESD